MKENILPCVKKYGSNEAHHIFYMMDWKIEKPRTIHRYFCTCGHHSRKICFNREEAEKEWNMLNDKKEVKPSKHDKVSHCCRAKFKMYHGISRPLHGSYFVCCHCHYVCKLVNKYVGGQYTRNGEHSTLYSGE